MTMMIWWQNTDPLATYSVQENLTLGLEEAEKKLEIKSIVPPLAGYSHSHMLIT